jgi:hypothetical protein
MTVTANSSSGSCSVFILLLDAAENGEEGNNDLNTRGKSAHDPSSLAK